MNGFEVTASAVHELASACTRAASAVEGLDVAGPLTTAGEALPGSQTEVATTGVAVKLGAAVQVLGEHMGKMAASAQQTASAYEAADAAVGDRFAPLGAR